MSRKINVIAAEICKDWKNVSVHAVPYLEAMESFESVNEMHAFGFESAASIIRYFLGNARTWRGEVAKRVKKELNEMIEGKY